MHAMLSVNYVFLGGAMAFAGCLSYARDTLRGVAKPNRVSWLLWSIATMLVAIAQIHEGVGLQWTVSFAISLGDLLVFATSFISRNGVWRLERFDIACGGASALGLVMWAVTADNTIALAAFIIADALACIPTLTKSWTAPHSETLSTYATAGASGLITLATVKVWSSGTVAFPIWLAFINLVFILLIGTKIRIKFRRDPITTV
jgi:hypothetical protein